MINKPEKRINDAVTWGTYAKWDGGEIKWIYSNVRKNKQASYVETIGTILQVTGTKGYDIGGTGR